MKQGRLPYALDIAQAVKHVAFKLERAAGAALSFDELIADYSHGAPSDISRVKLHNKLDGEQAANAWIVRHAIERLNGSLDINGNFVSFKDGIGLDDVRYDDNQPILRPGPDKYEKLKDPFNPDSGIFSDNIRLELRDGKDPGYDELRDSMKSWGWIVEFPALQDERGVTLVGNRRMAIAKELGIEPVIKHLKLGFGDAADAERLKLAIASNIGGKKLSPSDRKRIAMHLYTEHEWSQQKIAEALVVSQYTVSTDLNELLVTNNSKRGRPRKNTTSQPKKITPEQEQKAEELFVGGATTAEIARELEKEGVPFQPVRAAVNRIRGRLEGRAEVKAEAADTFTRTCTCPNCGHSWQPSLLWPAGQNTEGD